MTHYAGKVPAEGRDGTDGWTGSRSEGASDVPANREAHVNRAPASGDLHFALNLMDRVDAATLAHFTAVDFTVDTKPDFTPVTTADREAEQMIREAIAAAQPGDSVYGEEQGTTAGTGTGRRWIIDPIDGTKNFVRGVPVWATLLALEVEGEIVQGVVSAPALGRRWWARRGEGAWASAGGAVRRIRVSDVGDLADSSLSLSSLTGWEARGRLEAVLDLTRAVWRTRGFGDFWNYMLVAEGAVDIAAEPELELYDMAALVPIVEEAGGAFTDLEGNAGPWGGCAVATNGLLHSAVVTALGQSPTDGAQ